MRQIYRPQTIRKTIKIVLPNLLVVIAVFLLATQPAFTATEFQGSLNNVSITDAAGTNAPPKATFTYTQEDETFTFDASGSNDSDGTLTGYNWDFGDGQFGEGILISHVIEKGKEYHITLTTVDNAGGISLSQLIVSNNIETIITENKTTADTRVELLSNVSKGQSFVTNTTGVLTSIELDVTSLGGGSSRIITCRVDDDTDMTSEYIEEGTVTISATGLTPIFFTGKNQLTSGTKYYLGCISNYSVYIARSTSDTYAGGSVIYSSQSLWDMTKTTGGDITFTVQGK